MHRVSQFVSHLTARVSADDEATAHRMLPPSAWPLFDRMPVADRRHGLDVAARLLGGGIDDRDVLSAALLHDAAKGSRLRLWHRIVGVLLEAFAPGLLARLARRDPRATNAWHLYLRHADLSADAARQAGLSERASAFISGSVTEADVQLAAALHAADEAS
jgi:type IV secretory pathway TrbD component